MKRGKGEKCKLYVENEEWTEVNGDSKSTNEWGASLVSSLGLLCKGTRDFCSAFAALVGLVHNIFFFVVHYFNSFIPITQQAGQAAVLGRLSLKGEILGDNSLHTRDRGKGDKGRRKLVSAVKEKDGEKNVGGRSGK
jgi:hypothetical protein